MNWDPYRTKRPLAFALIGLSMALAHLAGAEGPAPAAAATCPACHGADGNSINPIWPSLAGQHASYTVAQLQDFKSGARQEPAMTPMAAPLSEGDIRELGEYYAGLRPMMGVANPAMIPVGESIYRGGNAVTGVPACMGCHGPSGAGNAPAGYPALRSQHADYVAAQLNLYKAGTRNNDVAEMMQTIASRLSDDEIAAVASYISGLH